MAAAAPPGAVATVRVCGFQRRIVARCVSRGVQGRDVRARAQGSDAEERRLGRQLDGAVRTINGILSVGDMFGSLGADKTVGGDSYDAGDVASERVSDTQKGASGGAKQQKRGILRRLRRNRDDREGRWVQLRGKSRSTLRVEEVLPDSTSPPGDTSTTGTSLVDYLALPVEQYSVLDPTWVSRPEGAPPGCFRLTVPLRDLAGVELEPTLLIRAGYVPEKTRVVLESVESSFGSPQWDAYASVSLKASLTRVDVADADDADRWLGQPESARSGAPTVDSDGVIDVEPIDNVRDADAPPVAGLRCSVEVLVDVRVPQSLRIVPGVVLRGAGSTILRAAMGVLLPSFLDLLAADYRRWATRSQPRDLPAGNLLPADAKLGEAPSANEDSPSSQS